MNRSNHVFACLLLLLSCAGPLAAQAGDYSFQAGVHLATVASDFESTDVGVGGRLSWNPGALLGLEGELTFYPGDLGGRQAFSGGRIEGLFGGTVGPRVGAFRPFAKLRPGFLTFREAGPIACILIFPPPLSCTLAAGRSLFALDFGGGVEWLPSGRAFMRVDAGDRMIWYPGPVIDASGTIQDESFPGHDFRFAVGGGVRF